MTKEKTKNERVFEIVSEMTGKERASLLETLYLGVLTIDIKPEKREDYQNHLRGYANKYIKKSEELLKRAEVEMTKEA